MKAITLTQGQITKALLEALKAMVEMFDCVAKKVNWGASFLDAEAIQKMNEAPPKARAAIRLVEQEAHNV